MNCVNKWIGKIKKYLFFFILTCFFVSFVYGDTTEKQVTWKLASQKFSGNEIYQEILPHLILKSFPENITRELSLEEQKITYEQAVKKEKQTLINKLKSLQDEKDQLFFKNIDEISKNKRRLEIEVEQEKIQKEIESFDEKKLREFEYRKTDATISFVDKLLDEDSLEDEKKTVDAILSGSVVEQKGFLFVKAKITILPTDLGKNFSMETTGVGSYSEIQAIASEIAQNFLSFIMNKEKVSLSVRVFPEEIRNKVSITIDGVTYKENVENLALQQGKHQVSVEALGYDTRDFSCLLEDSTKKYVYSVFLSPQEEVELFVKAQSDTLKTEEDFSKMDLYVGGIKQKVLFGEENLVSSFLVKKVPVLGEFSIPINTDENGEIKYASTFFRLSGNSTKPISIRTESSTTLIEKARKRMYTSYGILLITLPFSFYAKGRLGDIEDSINNGIKTEDLLKKQEVWQLTSKVTSGISISAGVNMLIQLIRYIYTANYVLPQIL